MGAETGARLGKGEYLVVEADESDGSFLDLMPVLGVITNIDNDHLAFYDNNIEKLRSAFVSFVHKLPFYGTIFFHRVMRRFDYWHLNLAEKLFLLGNKKNQTFSN